MRSDNNSVVSTV